jgi:hypothetical protein
VKVLKKSGGENGYKANFIQFDRYFDGHAVKKLHPYLLLATFFIAI